MCMYIYNYICMDALWFTSPEMGGNPPSSLLVSNSFRYVFVIYIIILEDIRKYKKIFTTLVNIGHITKYLKINDLFCIQLSSRACLLGCNAAVGLQDLGTLGLGTPVQAGCWCQKLLS